MMLQIPIAQNGTIRRKYSTPINFGKFNNRELLDTLNSLSYIKKVDTFQQLFIGDYPTNEFKGYSPNATFTLQNPNSLVYYISNSSTDDNTKFQQNGVESKKEQEKLVLNEGTEIQSSTSEKVVEVDGKESSKEINFKIDVEVNKEIIELNKKDVQDNTVDVAKSESTTDELHTNIEVKSKPIKQIKSWANAVKVPTSPNSQSLFTGKMVLAGSVYPKPPSSSNKVPLNEISKAFNKVFIAMDSPPFHTRGLNNPSFLCYANSIIQPILHIPPSYNLLLHLSTKFPQNSFEEMPILSALLEVFKETKGKNGKKNKELPIPSVKVINLIKAFGTKFDTQIGRQEDAQEFLSSLLNCLDEEFVDLFKKHNLNLETCYDEKVKSICLNTVESQPTSTGNSNEEWISVGAKSTKTKLLEHKSLRTPINAIFSGLYRSTLQLNGNPPKAVLNSSTILQVAIDSDDVTSLNQALEQYFHLEVLDELEHNTKKESFDQLPPILIIQLKLVQYNSDTGNYKLNKSLQIPLDLELNKNFLSNPNLASKLSYQLCSVIYHHGKEALAGHYNVDVKKSDGGWIYCNDEFVDKLLPDQVGKSDHSNGGSPYILFYQRK